MPDGEYDWPQKLWLKTNERKKRCPLPRGLFRLSYVISAEAAHSVRHITMSGAKSAHSSEKKRTNSA